VVPVAAPPTPAVKAPIPTVPNLSSATGANVPAISVNPAINEGVDTRIDSEIRTPTETPPSHVDAAAGGQRLRVIFCGTYPVGQTNGYAKVVYYICKYLGHYEDIDLHVWGFQNYKIVRGVQRNDIPASVTLHDALAKEDPKRHGFGEKEFGPFLKKNRYDIVIIFNDMVVTSALTSSIVQNLTPEERKQFKLISYMDQVYPYQRPQYIQVLNEYFDAVIAFTPYWAKVARDLGVTKPLFWFPHGFDKDLYFPVNQRLARLLFNLPEDAFIVGTTNRTQPRKALNHTLMSWAMCVERHWKKCEAAAASGAPKPQHILLVMGSSSTAFWNMEEIWADQMRRRGVPAAEGTHYIQFLPAPQTYTDRQINILYNAFDVHVSNVLGEGFGLIAFECAGIGRGVVAPDIGGHKEFLLPSHSILVKPVMESYLDNQTDGIGGLAEISNPADIAEGLWAYYTNPKLLKKHSARAREYILTNYQWPTMVAYFHDMLLHFKAGAGGNWAPLTSD
jgi:glycosyltransferase involved in cell wall biosynthesis